MAAKKRSSRKEGSALKKIASALPGWVLICIIAVGILFGTLVETGVLSLSQVQETLGFTVFDSLSENDDSSVSYIPAEAKRFAVFMIDVGQGDSFFINAGGTNVLIDAGEEEYGETVCSFLQSRDVESLDYIICTHPHSDHIGGMDDVINAFGAEKIIVPRVSDDMTPTTVCYENLLNAVKDKGMKLTAAKQGHSYDLGDIDGTDITMTVLSPCEGKDYDDLNDYSVAVRIDYGKTSWLFTGDMTERSEKDLIESGADIDVTALKVAHHGSNGSSGNAFLEAVTPRLCLISCGTGNSYGHPGEKALGRIEKFTSSVYRSDISGNVVVYSDGKTLYVSCEKKDS
ncbi:MAG: ComEC/Rec2 family competence protein [Huintestinicola sp.]